MSRVPGWTSVSSLALRFALFAGVAACAQLAGPAWAGVIHRVKADATGANNGHSWANAYTDLQAALAAAVSGDEIWVARGTYKPTSGTLRTVSFVLEAGVGLYGGFAGVETELGQRNWETNATILSGNIGITSDTADNSYHVVVGADLAVLDGFTITGGNANVTTGTFSQGGGMYNLDCSPDVTNCTFSGNTASDCGGGMLNSSGSPTVTNCTFSGNVADNYGGGMYNSGGSPDVTNCTFSGNVANLLFWVSGGYGGGMYNENCSPDVTNCTFSGNSANYSGGGMLNDSDSSPTVTNCTFSDNSAGGGIYGGFGGGMYNGNSSPDVTNCTFSGNTADNYYGGSGGGMFNFGSSPDVTNCTFSGNTAYSSRGGEGYGGGMYNGGGSPTMINCTFSGNATGSGGGMYNVSSSPDVTNCTFSANTASGRYTYAGIFGGYGGGMDNEDSSPDVTNCTFSGNSAATSGGGMCNFSSSSTVTNSIFWDNTAPLDAEIYGGTPTFRHCDIKGSGGSGALWDPALGADGGGNIMADPRFVAPATPAGADGLWRTSDDGLRLRSDSPCIGAADPAVAPPKDILGLPRGSAPDIGAYEFWPPASAGPAWVLFR